jgi:glycine reductase
VITKEIENVGIPVAFITTFVDIATSAGVHRIIRGRGITHPLGDPSLSPENEKEIRRTIVLKALEAVIGTSKENGVSYS